MCVCAIQFDIWRFGSDISFSDTVSSTVGIFPIEIYSTFFVCQPMQITKFYSMLINRNNISAFPVERICTFIASVSAVINKIPFHKLGILFAVLVQNMSIVPTHYARKSLYTPL